MLLPHAGVCQQVCQHPLSMTYQDICLFCALKALQLLSISAGHFQLRLAMQLSCKGLGDDDLEVAATPYCSTQLQLEATQADQLVS